MGMVIEVRSNEPRYNVQFGQDAATVQCVRSDELALVQKYIRRDSNSSLAFMTS